MTPSLRYKIAIIVLLVSNLIPAAFAQKQPVNIFAKISEDKAVTTKIQNEKIDAIDWMLVQPSALENTKGDLANYTSTIKLEGMDQDFLALSLKNGQDKTPEISINESPERLHFLQTLIAGKGLEKFETKFAESGRIPAHPPQVFGYELKYADGTTNVLHMDWMHHLGRLDLEKMPSHFFNAKPIVISEKEPRQVLYHCVMPNPYPGKTIETVRMVKPEKGEDMGQPLLLGMAFEKVAPVEAMGYKWGCNDYSYEYGPTHVVAENDGQTLKVPIQNKSDRAALAYLDQKVTGDFSVSMRLNDISRYANWASVGLSATPVVIYTGRGGTQENIAVYFKPKIQEGAKKDGIFVVSNGEPVKGGVVLDDGKPPVSISDESYKYQTPIWTRLDRKGDIFTGYISKDGQKWDKLGERKAEGLPESLYLTIYTCLSHAPKVEYATIDNFKIEQ